MFALIGFRGRFYQELTSPVARQGETSPLCRKLLKLTREQRIQSLAKVTTLVKLILITREPLPFLFLAVQQLLSGVTGIIHPHGYNFKRFHRKRNRVAADC